MMDVSLTVDWREFNEALTSYAAATGKTMAQACNRQMNNVAIKGIELTKKAESGVISALQRMFWWPLYMSKIVAQTGASGADRDVKALSNAIIRRRKAAIGFLRFFYASISQVFAAASGGSPRGSGRQFSGFSVNAKLATEGDTTASAVVVYNYKKRSQNSANKATLILNNSVHNAIARTTYDMMAYTERKLAELARRYSGRAA